jgi:DNA invertase Pin-like site-specific DNA recombinase
MVGAVIYVRVSTKEQTENVRTSRCADSSGAKSAADR